MNVPVTRKLNEKRYPEHLKIIEEVMLKVSEWIINNKIPTQKTPLDFVLNGIVTHSYNIYKSISILLAESHWNTAAVLSRSLFELLLNIYEITKEEKSSIEKSRKFLRYGEVQKYLLDRRALDCLRREGQIPENVYNGMCSKFDSYAKSHFQEFLIKGKKKNKNKIWRDKLYRTWNGKTVKQMVVESSVPSIIDEYNLVYSFSSYLSHSSPYSLENNRIFEDDNLKEIEENEKRFMTHVLMISTKYFFEILKRSKSMIPNFEEKWTLVILKKIGALYKK